MTIHPTHFQRSTTAVGSPATTRDEAAGQPPLGTAPRGHWRAGLPTATRLTGRFADVLARIFPELGFLPAAQAVKPLGADSTEKLRQLPRQP